MIRQHFQRPEADPDFRWRGGSVSRIEGLSDGVFALFVLLHVNAYRRRELLELNELECLLTRADTGSHVVSTAIGALALVLAILGFRALSGMSFFLTGPAHGFYAYCMAVRIQRLKERHSGQGAG